MAGVGRVLETALYCDDVARAATFYHEVLGCVPLLESARLVALDAGDRTVLLLFQRGATTTWFATPGGRIPPHDGSGPQHIAFAIAAGDWASWERRLAGRQVEIESRVDWPEGGRSLYFRDPDGHSVELATPGTWANY